MADKEPLKPRYLGDGVYVHDQGFHLILAVNDHNNKVVYLEKEVVESLVQFAKEADFIK